MPHEVHYARRDCGVFTQDAGEGDEAAAGTTDPTTGRALSFLSLHAYVCLVHSNKQKLAGLAFCFYFLILFISFDTFISPQ